MSNKIQNIILAVLSIALIGITVAYALLTQQLNINSTATAKGGTWDVHFESLVGTATGGASIDTSSSKLAIQTGSTTISGVLGTLVKPGDSITYTFNIVNDGSIDAILNADLTATTPTCSGTDSTGATYVCDNLTYTLTYSDGTSIKKGDTLASKETKAAKLTLTFNSSATSIPSSDVTIENINATLDYVQN